MRKILYSPGFGAGWSTWQEDVPKVFACQYPPIIAALENDEELVLNKDVSDHKREPEDYHQAVRQYLKDCKELYNAEPYLGGIDDLCIFSCEDHAMVRIKEYDGAESVEVGYTDYF